MGNLFDAFISYGRADSKGFATKLYDRLLEQGLNVWFDQNDIPLGVDFQNQIDDGIEKAHNFLFLIAPHSINSPYCGKEIDLALKRNKRIIPLLHVEQITQETWQQRFPTGTVEDWEAYRQKGLHSSFPNMHPAIGKINWVYEKRIFMFVDLNSSTSVAERLGEKKYHQLLKDFFAHITNPIIDNDGEIYQYVGDEVVVVWNYAKGITDNHCIRCFYAMKREIERRSEYYLQAYGLIPTFKAGIHYGNVITGEIGIIKRDITFSGDVLNTASRMLGKCKELNVEMVASSELLHGLPALDHANIRELGSIQLRGKIKNIELSTLISAV